MTAGSFMNSTSRRPYSEMTVRVLENETYSAFTMKPDKVPEEINSLEDREERQYQLQ